MAIEDRDLTTIMGTLGGIRDDVRLIRELLEDDDNGEEEEASEAHPPEERARFDEFTREIRARIAERRAREREQDAQGQSGR